MYTGERIILYIKMTFGFWCQIDSHSLQTKEIGFNTQGKLQTIHLKERWWQLYANRGFVEKSTSIEFISEWIETGRDRIKQQCFPMERSRAPCSSFPIPYLILLGPESWGRRPVLSRLPRSSMDDLGVNGARHAVVELGVQLGQSVHFVDWGVGDISDGGSLDNVTDHELFDRLILGSAPGAVGTSDRLDVSSALLGPSIVATFLSHFASEIF